MDWNYSCVLYSGIIGSCKTSDDIFVTTSFCLKWFSKLYVMGVLNALDVVLVVLNCISQYCTGFQVRSKYFKCLLFILQRDTEVALAFNNRLV